MTNVLTDDDIAVGDVVSTQLEKMWGWYLAGGIISMIFGFFVISYRHASVYAIIYLASGFFIAVGLFEIIGGVPGGTPALAAPRLRRDLGRRRASSASCGRTSPSSSWPCSSAGASWCSGIFDIVNSIRYHYLPYWWAYLIRGIVAVALGFLCIRHPGAPLTALVVLIGILAIVFGAVEVIGAFSARHATKHWEAFKAQAQLRHSRGAAVRLASFSLADGRPRPGLIVGDEILDLSDPATGLPADHAGRAGPRRRRPGTGCARRRPARRPATTLAAVRRHAPVPDPPAILAIGMNYRAHVAEMGREPPEWQYWFNKQRTSIAGPGDPIVLPSVSDMVDYEGELALVIGPRCQHVPAARAFEVVAGFTIINDVSARDWQWRTPDLHPGQVLRHPRALWPRAGDRRRARRPGVAGHPHLGQRRAAPGLDDGRPDLRLRRDDRVPDHGIPARAGDHHRHRDARPGSAPGSTRRASWRTATPCASRIEGIGELSNPVVQGWPPGQPVGLSD